ncbi:GDP-mannose 4,6-dehydratase [Paenibacillus sp. N3/727]|uniref:GDP-mannose 4,6-dehydratase n=1 Tax=Paenibacillus sp. N3/727 TaxID=2925845 RepID=UPI001F52F691|nr:GDP-mannose 4,6-dehydratase [Paenibacillus sp. N3/727]UNK18773.1 GDP-mannose 4,6-dehydratase [Paenibacillus sp. N3/727]
MKALITGVSGFVGKYLAQNLIDHGYEVWGTSRVTPPFIINGVNIINIDFSHKDTITKAMEDVKPDVIFHLSGQSSVQYSWSHINETFQSNVMDAIGLFEAIKDSTIKKTVRIVSIGSSEEYGLVKDLPIMEDADTNPGNPYGLSKLTLSKLVLSYCSFHEMNIIHARAFNHIGPGQALGFVTSDFANQLINIELGKVEPVISVGDLSSKRDFTDVRDIVEAYRLLFEKGKAGEVYNVCSGKCVSIQDILTLLLSFSSKQIEVIVNKDKLRPNNVPEYYGSNHKLTETTGWAPSITLENSLKDIYIYWKDHNL